MTTGGMEASSDGVIAIIIAIIGAGDEGAARRSSDGFNTVTAGVSQLCPEFHLRRHLLK
jgi:hypothetical protein